MRVARDADVVIAGVGDSRPLHGEWRDRATLDLTGAQQQLLEAVAETGVPMVVVLVNSKPLAIPWVVEHANAIVEAWNPGAEGGTAVAGILFGDRSPSGKLTISWPRHVGQQPAYYNHLPGWHGSKYVDMERGPLFAFGYGLSYTTFAYSNLEVEQDALTACDTLRVSVDVENTGRRDGVEIVQLYTNDVVSSVTTPVKELKAFQRVEIAAGAKVTLSFEVPCERLALVNRDRERVVEPGEFEVLVGPSSRDEDLLKARFTVTA